MAQPPKIAIVHYHLAAGGVARVIERVSAALTAIYRPHVILIGPGQEPPPPGLPVREIPGLGYLKTPGGHTAAELAAAMRAAASAALGEGPLVWHIHNHSLGKNVLMPALVALLAADQERIVLHIHDLAEDGRPGNYPLIAGYPDLYPLAPNIRYVFLNTRDAAVFHRAGLPLAWSSVLRNPSEIRSPRAPEKPAGDCLVFYPVRGIRRKNLGELLLLAGLAPIGMRFAISRAPENPQDRAIHDSWQDFAIARNLPVDFTVTDRLAPRPGRSPSFESWMESASFLLTTSVAEGYGLVFTDAIARALPLIGRDLPHVTSDLPGGCSGVLYDRLLIDRRAVEEETLMDAIREQISASGRLYREEVGSAEQILKSFGNDPYLDFGNLPEPLQQAAIERAIDPLNDSEILVERRGKTQSIDHWLLDLLNGPQATASATLPEDAMGELLALYDDLATAETRPPGRLNPGDIRRGFLAPARFRFLASAMPSPPRYRAVIFDIYGTLLIAPPGAIRPDPDFDPELVRILQSHGYVSPESPTRALHEAILRHHQASSAAYPEIDMREIWGELLGETDLEKLGTLVTEIEAARLPCAPMPDAGETLHQLAAAGVMLGILSNAQCNTLGTLEKCLGPVGRLFQPELVLLSYQHRIAKPSPELLALLKDRLAAFGIRPEETLIVGNDPRQDILPATAAGFSTALFTGHPESLREGECVPDLEIMRLDELVESSAAATRNSWPRAIGAR